FLRDNLQSCSIVEERALESSESSTSSSRPDISIPEKNITLDVSVCYEDASLMSVEKRMENKRAKYQNCIPVVIGHSGFIMPKTIDELSDLARVALGFYMIILVIISGVTPIWN
ncbi:hypothetical protein ADUPG1_004036, partial [Aduncisulcus paluster]